LFAALWLANLLHLGGGLETATWAQWANMAGKIFALGVALSAIVVKTRSQLLHDRTALSAWMDLEADAEGRPYWVVKALNKTGLPILAWNIESDGGVVHLCSQEHGPLVPEVNRYNPKLDFDPEPSRTLPLAVEFTDSEGDSWRREPTGLLLRSTKLHPCPRT
jgi:hypothetical protein